MELPRSRTIRLAWLLNTALLLAVLLPGAVEHPYPLPIRPYLQWGGLLLWLAVGFTLLALASRRRKAI